MTAEVVRSNNMEVAGAPLRLPPVPWRDPHTVSPKDLERFIGELERECVRNPESADLRTCLGMAYAMNYDVYKSMDALEHAVTSQPDHFFAQLKFAELHYRVRALIRAEEETIKAVDLATNSWELGLARKQLQEIRRLQREGTQKPEWTKSLKSPAIALLVMTLILCVMVNWK